MPNDNTRIQLMRSSKTFEQLKEEPLAYGEPVFFKQEDADSKNTAMGIGNNNEDVTQNTVENATLFEGISNPDLLGKSVYFNDKDKREIISKSGEFVAAAMVSPSEVYPGLENGEVGNKKYWVLSFDRDNKVSTNVHYHTNEENGNIGIYVSANGVLNGAAWNDYAERRTCTSGSVGEVVCENGDGTLSLSKEKLQPLPYVISDTCGMVIGFEGENNLPIAVSGRALVKVNCEVKLGDVLCADKDGYATVMTRKEIANYPDRILGVVSEIPSYTNWNGVEVNDRIWITLK